MFSNIMRVIFNPNNNFIIIIIIIIFFLPMDWREYRVRLKHGIMVQYPPPKKKPQKQQTGSPFHAATVTATCYLASPK